MLPTLLSLTIDLYASAIIRCVSGLQTTNTSASTALSTLLPLINNKKKKGKVLDLQQRKEYHGGAMFWSPVKIREANAREAVKHREDKEMKVQKADLKALKESNKLYKKKIAEVKRVARGAAKVERERERAAKAAERAAKIKANNTKQAIQTTQNGKRKATRASSSNPKRQKGVGGRAVVAASPEAAPAAPPKVTRRGRNVTLPHKYK